MTIFVTGACGFIGRHLLPRLLDMGHNIITYDLRPPESELCSRDSIEVITADLELGEKLDQVVWENVDVVIHLAAAGVTASQRNWSKCIASNIVGTLQLICAMGQISSPPLLIYPQSFYTDSLDEFPDLKNDPYFATKDAAGKAVKLWAQTTQNARVLMGRIFQVYGSADDFGSVLSYTAKCLIDNVPAKLGSGKGVRDWIYIDDAVDCLVRALTVPVEKIQYFDLGTGELTSLKDMVEILGRLAGGSKGLLEFDPKRDRGDTEIKSYAENILDGWQPRYSKEEGLAFLVNNIKKNTVHSG